MVNNPRRKQMKIRAIILSMVMLCSLAMATDYFTVQVTVQKPAGTPQSGAYVTLERSGYVLNFSDHWTSQGVK
jgi:hypothetical protein